jgi:NAD(P)-dependent dehydrogenase (short-subunit alcohol dehydrogenase family)
VDSTNRRVEMLLDNKNAIIYRAGGSIGGAVAKECARGGASVFLTGRKRENLETVAKEITAAGGAAEVAVVDALVRSLAAEIGPRGVRVVGIWTAGLPEAFTKEKLAAVDSTLALDDAAYQGLLDSLDRMRMTRRSPRLNEVATTAAFLASEKAGTITGTFVNVTSGTFPS